MQQVFFTVTEDAQLQLDKKESPQLARVKMTLFTFGAPAVIHFNQRMHF